MKFDIIKFLHFETMLTPLWETVYMVAIATLVSLIIGLPIGVLLVISEPKGVKPNRTLHKILDVLLVNITRSIPFVILIVLLIPLSRLLIGKSYGSVSFIVPLSLGSAPFIARIIEGALKEVDEGLVEASKAMGATTKEIIFSAAETPVIATWKSEVNVLIGIKNSGANIKINSIGNKPKLPFKNNLTEVTIASIVPA